MKNMRIAVNNNFDSKIKRDQIGNKSLILRAKRKED